MPLDRTMPLYSTILFQANLLHHLPYYSTLSYYPTLAYYSPLHYPFSRADACRPHVSELNPYTAVDACAANMDTDADLAFLKTYQVTFCLVLALALTVELASLCWSYPKRYWADSG